MHISSSYAKILGETNFHAREIPGSGSKAEDGENTPGTAGVPGGRDRTLAVAKNRAKMTFFSGGEKNYPKKIFFFCIYLLVMPKYWVKNYFAHGRFPEVGQKQKTEEKKEERKRSESW